MYTLHILLLKWASLVAQMVKNPPANAGDLGSILESGRSPEEGNAYPLQFSHPFQFSFHRQGSLAGYNL